MKSLYAVTLLLSSLLLFCVEPMVARALLPLCGGSSSVWITCMVFFQLALLAGYAYAHGGPRLLGLRAHAALHLLLLPAGLYFLPLRFEAGDVAGWPASANPAPRLIALLLVKAALPFVLLSASAPLLQRWFASAKRPGSGDPYWLYAASNVGSLAGLLGYPLAMEPLLGLAGQGTLWTAGYLALALLVAVCAVPLLRHGSTLTLPSPQASGGAPSLMTRLRWLALAAVPSSLLSGVTSHLTTDVASVPLLWVLPLALYLATFVAVFSSRPLLSQPAASRALALPSAITALLLVSEAEGPLWLIFASHLGTFFLAALVCHGELSSTRPPPERLTEFYLWMSLGGLLGGVFNALLAPLLFSGFAEYPLMLVAACAFRLPVTRPSPSGQLAQRSPEGFLASRSPEGSLASRSPEGFLASRSPEGSLASRSPEGSLASRSPEGSLGEAWWGKPAAVIAPTAALLVLTLLLSSAARAHLADAGKMAVALAFLPPLLLNMRQLEHPLRYALGLGAVLLASLWHVGAVGKVIYRARSFYGVHRVSVDSTGKWRQLVDGDTVHGRQALDPQLAKLAPGYYHPSGPMGEIVREHHRAPAAPLVAVVGLGAGAMAPHAGPGETWWFFELDPQVVEIARDPRLFTFLADAFPGGNGLKITTGDARLRLSEAPDHGVGLLLLDAFSGDAVPTHLLTAEAMALFDRKLAPGGLIGLHVSNRYLALAPVVAASAATTGDAVRCWADTALTEREADEGKLPSHWCVVARGDRPALRRAPWQLVSPAPRPWTDDRVSLLSALSWRPRQ